MSNINASDMDQVWKKGVIHCDVKLLNFTKRAIKEAVKTEEFKALDKGKGTGNKAGTGKRI